MATADEIVYCPVCGRPESPVPNHPFGGVKYICKCHSVKAILTRLNFRIDEEVYVLTNEDVATVVIQKLEDDEIELESLSDDELSSIFCAAIDGAQEGIDWTSPMRDNIDAMHEWRDPNDADDEGPLTEQYENSSRLHDDDWMEAAYEERWEE